MKELSKTELFTNYFSKKPDDMNSLMMKLNTGIGDIAPNHIETELMLLKSSKSSSYMPFLSDGIAYYENFNGRIRLVNMSNNNNIPLPVFIPFLKCKVRDRHKEGTGVIATSPAIVMNMFRIGHWSVDGTTYDGLVAKGDLYQALETGAIMNSLLIDGTANKVFSNETVLKHLTKIYANLFANVMKGASGINFGGDFEEDAALFIISKFFLSYCVELPESDLMNDIAHNTVRHFSTMSSMEEYANNSGITYDSLSGFLNTFADKFFNKEMSMQLFATKWAQMYGEATFLAVEYIPYLLHFLFAAYHGATIGGALKLYNKKNDLENYGLVKLYNAVIGEVK